MPAQPAPGTDNVVPIRPGQPDTAAHPWERPEQLRPVLPHWLTDKETRKAAVRWARRHVTHHVGWHAARTPKHLTRIALCTPRGLVLALLHLWRWICDRDAAGTHELRVDAAARRDHKAFATMARIRRDRVRTRSLGLAASAVLATVLAVVVRLEWPPGLYVLAVAVAIFLAWLGRPRNAPLIERPAVPDEVAKVTPDIVVRALGSLGLASVSQHLAKGGDIRVMVGREGPGWHVEAELPFGTTATDVADRRERFASGLRRPLGAVWPEPARGGHAGLLHCFVGDTAMSEARQAPWPLARTGHADLFAPLPFGTDPRGRNVALPLMYSNLLTGGLPGSGKTMATRIVLLGAALDPIAELRVWELAGRGDLAAFEKVAYRYGCGVDDGTIGDCLADLRDVHAELERRAKRLAGMPRDLIPENKVTKAIAIKRSLGLHPLAFAISECQELFAHPVYGAEAGDLCTAIIKRGRALAVMLVLDTQRPDAKSLPTGISVNAGTRYGLRIMDSDTNDRLLGAGTYKAGIRATEFTPDDLGIGLLIGAGPVPVICRSYYIDAPGADRIAARARATREAAGLLSGYCAGDAPAASPKVSLLADIAAVMPEPKAHLTVIAARLAELRPGLYGGWDERQAGAALRGQGVEPVQVWDGGTNRNGVTRDLVTAAAGKSRA